MTTTAPQTRTTKVISVSMDPQLLAELDSLRWSSRMTRSQAVAAAVRSFLTENGAKVPA